MDKNSLDFLYKCNKCKIEKPNREFGKASHSKSIRKFTNYCRICCNLFCKEKQYSSKKNKRLRVEDPILSIYRYAQSGAKSRNLIFKIDVQYVRNLYSNQLGNCYYSNRTLDINLGNENSISLDRINSSKGYEEGNVVLCSWQINRMKNDINLIDLISICNDISNNFKKENI